MLYYKIVSKIFLCSLLCLVIAAGQVFTAAPSSALTIGEERDKGEQLLYVIRTEFRLLDDPDISQYINDLGQQVLSQVGPKYFDYHFFVVPSPEFNAFAAPAGLIFFYSGLIETMKNEDELLSVLAHEIGHVESRHISSRSSKSGKVGAISMALAVASLALGDPSLAAGLFTGFQAAGQAANLHFSRVDEEEADRLSYNWMQGLRRDPRAMEGMLRTMRRITRYRSGQMPPYLLTHPNPEARMDYVQSLLDYQESSGEKSSYVKTDNFAFLRMKYRVMVAVADPQKARATLTNEVATATSTEEMVMAKYGLALLEARELNYDKAFEYLETVHEQYPDRNIINVDAGIMYLDSGKTQKAVELLQETTKIEPYNIYGLFHLARAYTKTGQVDDAERLYLRVMRAMPEYPKVYFELGRIKANQGQTGTSNYYLGKYYLYEGRVKFAREYFVKTKNDVTVSDAIRQEAENLLKRLDELDEL